MIAALVALTVIAGGLGLLGLCAGMRASQCSRLLEEAPELVALPEPYELPRAA